MTTLFATVALVLGLARLVLFIALHRVESDYNIVEHAVSDYAVGRTRALSSVMTWTTAGMWLALALAVGEAFPDSEDLATVRIFLFVLAVIFVVLPFLPTDVEGEEVTLIGRLHLLAAVAWFALAYAGMGDLVDVLESLVVDPIGAALVVLSWVALVSLVTLVAALVIRPARRYAFGISERVFLVAVNLFYVEVALALLTT